MATSGSYNWKLNRDQVITAALRKLAVLPSGGTPSTAQVNDGVDALNALLKRFHADGMPLWVITSQSFTTTAGTSSYSIGVGQTINAAPPLKIIQARRQDNNTTPPVPMIIYNRYDFNILPQLSTIQGTPVQLYYQPLGEGSNGATGIIKIWPTPDDSVTTILVDYQRPFQDMDAATDDLDFPNYWTQAIIYGLAWVLAPEYGIPPTDRGILAKEAEFFHTEALSFGSEEGSLYMQPDWQGRWNS